MADDFQGRGLGTILLVHLAEAAEEQGVGHLRGQVLPENYRMAEVFRESGFSVRMRSKPDLISVEMPTTISAAALRTLRRPGAHRRGRRRPQGSSSRASVAVIGASRERGTVGAEVFHNLLAAGFNGPVHPINPHADVVQSVRAFKSVRDVTGEVELAVVAVPAAAVIDAARECAAKGVKALVVISAGFAETGAEGAARQHELVRICRESGMRLVGPNCLGVLNTLQTSG